MRLSQDVINYGLLITNQVIIVNGLTNNNILGSVSFWVVFGNENLVIEQVIVGTTASNGINITKELLTNEIVFRRGTVVVKRTGIIVEANKLYHFAVGVKQPSPADITFLETVINGLFYDFDSIGLGGIFPYFGNAGCNFAVFSINLFNRDFRLGYTPIGRLDLQFLYSGGYCLANPRYLPTTTIFSSALSVRLSSEPINEGSLLIDNSQSSTGSSANTGIGEPIIQYVRYITEQGSLPKNLYEIAKDWQPIINNNNVVFRHTNYTDLFGSHKGNQLIDYEYEGLYALVLNDLTINVSSYNCPTTLEEITLTNCLLGAAINNFRGRRITLTSCTGNLGDVNISLLNSILFSVTSCNANLFLLGLTYVILNPNIINCFGSNYFIEPKVRGVFTITNNIGYFNLASIPRTIINGNRNNLSNQNEMTGLFITSLSTESGINTESFGGDFNNLDLTNCYALTDIRITRGDKFDAIVLPDIARLTRLDLQTVPVKLANCDNFNTHATTFTYLDLRTTVVFANNLDLSTFVNLTLLWINCTGVLTLPVNNNIVNIIAEHPGLTQVTYLSRNITGLYLRGTPLLAQAIDLTNHNVNMSDGLFLGGSGITSLILPTTTGRTISRFSLNDCTACQVPTLPTWNMFVSGNGTSFTIANCIHTNVITSLPLGTIIRSRSINISQNNNGRKMPIAVLRASIENLYTNITNMENNTIQKVLNAAHPDLVAPLRTPTLITGAGYIQANSTTDGADGIGTATYNTATDQQKISHIAFVLINQNVNKTTTKRYNYSISL